MGWAWVGWEGGYRQGHRHCTQEARSCQPAPQAPPTTRCPHNRLRSAPEAAPSASQRASSRAARCCCSRRPSRDSSTCTHCSASSLETSASPSSCLLQEQGQGGAGAGQSAWCRASRHRCCPTRHRLQTCSRSPHLPDRRQQRLAVEPSSRRRCRRRQARLAAALRRRLLLQLLQQIRVHLAGRRRDVVVCRKGRDGEVMAGEERWPLLHRPLLAPTIHIAAGPASACLPAWPRQGSTSRSSAAVWGSSWRGASWTSVCSHLRAAERWSRDVPPSHPAAHRTPQQQSSACC